MDSVEKDSSVNPDVELWAPSPAQQCVAVQSQAFRKPSHSGVTIVPFTAIAGMTATVVAGDYRAVKKSIDAFQTDENTNCNELKSDAWSL